MFPPDHDRKEVKLMLFYDGHKVYMNGEYPAIYMNGKSHHIHRIQWLKFYDSIPNGCVIHHKDENKMNWSIDNLELMTRTEHILEHKDIVHRKGVKCTATKNGITISFDSIQACAEYTGTHSIQIHRCFKGIQKQSKGWTFRMGGDYHSIL